MLGYASLLDQSLQQQMRARMHLGCHARRTFPNAIGKAKGERQSFVGDQLLSYRDASSLALRRPFDRCAAYSCCGMHSQPRDDPRASGTRGDYTQQGGWIAGGMHRS